MHRKSLMLLAAGLATVGLTHAAQASTIWTNGNATSEWNDVANWSGGLPNTTSATDALFDSTSPAGTITVTGPTNSVRHINFGSAADTGAAVGAFVFNDGGSGVINVRNAAQNPNQDNDGTPSVQTFNVKVVNAGSAKWQPVGAGFIFNAEYALGTGLTIDNDNASPPNLGNKEVQFNGGITGTGGFTISSAAPVKFGAGGATFSGAVNINNGSLQVNGAHTDAGAYTVALGATLGGTGSITSTSPVTVNGTLAPGASIGSLGILGTGGADVNGTLAIELNSTTNAIDVLNVTGALDLSGATITFSDAGPEALPDQALVFANYGSIATTGVIAVAPLGYTIDFNYGGTNSQAALVPVPEPTALGLAAIGAVGFLRRRRK